MGIRAEGIGRSRSTTVVAVVGIRTKGIGRSRSTTARAVVGIRTKGIGRSRSTTRPPAGAEGSGCTVYQRGWWHELTALRVLAHHAVCEARRSAFICAVVGIDVS